MTLSLRSGAVVSKNHTGTVLRVIQPYVEHQSRRELSHVSNDHLHVLKQSTV
jgi:hypothetical protein